MRIHVPLSNPISGDLVLQIRDMRLRGPARQVGPRRSPDPADVNFGCPTGNRIDSGSFAMAIGQLFGLGEELANRAVVCAPCRRIHAGSLTVVDPRGCRVRCRCRMSGRTMIGAMSRVVAHERTMVMEQARSRTGEQISRQYEQRGFPLMLRVFHQCSTASASPSGRSQLGGIDIAFDTFENSQAFRE